MKHLWKLALCLVLLAGLVIVAGVAPARAVGTITVYFIDALNWGAPNIYYWNDGPAWPGNTMTADGTVDGYNQYKATIPAGTVGIVFNANGKQTADIATGIADGAKWYTTGEMEYNNYIAALYTGSGNGGGSGDTITVCFVDSLGWGTPNIYWYYFDPGTHDYVSNDWPGTAMEADGQNCYTAAIPAAVENIRFNCGNNQTEFISTDISNGATWHATGEKDYNECYCVELYTAPAVTPAQVLAVNPANAGTITEIKPVPVPTDCSYGDSFTPARAFQATANDGYELDGVKYHFDQDEPQSLIYGAGEVDDNSYERLWFLNQDDVPTDGYESLTVTASFTQAYALTVPEGVSVDFNTYGDKRYAKEGKQITLGFNINNVPAGYETDNLIVTPQGGEAAELSLAQSANFPDLYWCAFTMPAAPVTVTYKPVITYGLYTTINGDGGVTFSVNGDSVNQAALDDLVTFTVAPDPDWALAANGLSVTYEDGEGVTQTITPTQDANDPTKYTFTMPAYDIRVTAEFERTGYSYIDYVNGAAVTKALTIGTDEFTLHTDESSTSWGSGWYVAEGTVEIGSRVNVSGDVHLILCDGANLTVTGGINVAGKNSLTIYAQSGGTGALTVSGVADDNAGIGGGNSSQSGGTVTINGGDITVTGGYDGAGIGGGYGGSGGTVTVNGGTVHATGGNGGAGIGGGYQGAGGIITVNGGTVYANGGEHGAGIGGGLQGAGGNITVTGGMVYATGYFAAGIGPGNSGSGGTLTVDFSSASDSLKASSYGGTVQVAGGKVVTDSHAYYAGELSGNEKSAIAGKTLVKDDTAYIVHRSVTGQGTITVSPSAALADTEITFTLSPAAGYVLFDLTVTYTDANSQTVTITPTPDANGQYSFTMPAAHVTVSAVFGHTVTVADGIEHGSVTADKTKAAQGETVTLTVEPADSAYAIGTVSYNDGTEDHVIEPDANGEYSFLMPDKDVTVTATFGRDVNDDYITVSLGGIEYDPGFPYTGNPVEPTVTVVDQTDIDNPRTLTLGTDFIVRYENNIGSANETTEAAAVITGIGAYAGTRTETFRVTPGNISACTIAGTPTTYDTGGYGIDTEYLNNSFQVMNGETQLELDTDYTLDFELPASYYETYVVPAGSYPARIVGRGDWGGTLSVTVTVVALKHTVIFDPGEGSGEMASISVGPGFCYVPECEFTAPYERYAFDYWVVDYPGITENPIKRPAMPGHPDADYFTAPYIHDPDDLTTITLTAHYSHTIRLRYAIENGTATCQVGGLTPVNLATEYQEIPAAPGSTVTLRISANDPAVWAPCMPAVYIETFDPNGDVQRNNLPISRAGVEGSVYAFTFTMPNYPVELTSIFFAEPETVTFDSDGGSAVPAQTVAWRDPADPPEDPTKEGFRFIGWFEVTGTNPETLSETVFDFENTRIYENITLKAKWARLYTVTLDVAEHGTMTASLGDTPLASGEKAAEGDTVTLSVEPAAGYLLDTLTVTDANGDPVSVENDAFTMPACNVQVNATFATITFGTPDFVMPSALTTIEESAFEGMTNMKVVDARSVSTIGKWAFKGCTGLTQIRLAKDCDIDPYAFTGCGTVYVYAPAGGTTQAYCTQETNPCVFVEETDETLSSFTDPSGTVYTFPSGSNLPSIPVLP